MKSCTKCKLEKPLNEFGKQTTGKFGVRSQCKICEKAYRDSRYYGDKRSELLKQSRERAKTWREYNPEKYRATKAKYYASDKGKSCKRREEDAYIKSGKRALTEKRRAKNPISEARKLARVKYSVVKRTQDKGLNSLDLFVLSEAIKLAKDRRNTTNIAWHIDHIIPVSKGGTSTYSNIQVVPAKWNQQKSNKHELRYFY